MEEPHQEYFSAGIDSKNKLDQRRMCWSSRPHHVTGRSAVGKCQPSDCGTNSTGCLPYGWHLCQHLQPREGRCSNLSLALIHNLHQWDAQRGRERRRGTEVLRFFTEGQRVCVQCFKQGSVISVVRSVSARSCHLKIQPNICFYVLLNRTRCSPRSLKCGIISLDIIIWLLDTCCPSMFVWTRSGSAGVSLSSHQGEMVHPVHHPLTHFYLEAI